MLKRIQISIKYEVNLFNGRGFVRIIFVSILFLMAWSNLWAKKNRRPHESAMISQKQKRGPFKNSLGLRYLPHHLRYWEKYFAKKRRAKFIRFLKNGARFKTIIEGIFQKNGLPQQPKQRRSGWPLAVYQRHGKTIWAQDWPICGWKKKHI